MFCLFRKIRVLLAATLLVIICPKAAASTPDYKQPFKLNLLNDGILLGTGTALSGSAFVCNDILHLKKNTFNASDWNKDVIPSFDKFFMKPYNKNLHMAGNVSVGLALVTPAVFAIMPSEQWLTIGTMYLETILLANGIKEWMKFCVNRARPYMYFEGYPQNKVDEGDWDCSFPSGHTTFAFAAAAFTTTVFCQCFSDSNFKYVVAGGTFGIAALTGVLRMASGNHFFTDVLIGALIGSVCGVVIPLMHTDSYYSLFEKRERKLNASVTPTGLQFSYNF